MIMFTKKVSKSVLAIGIIITLVIGIIILCLSSLFRLAILQDYYEKPLVGRLESALRSEKWSTYTNKKLGYSFSYPPSWKITGDKNLTIDGCRECEIALSVWDGDVTFFTIYKINNQNKSDIISSKLVDINYSHEQKIINNKEYTILRMEFDGEAGRYVISKDEDMMIYIINGYRVDNSSKASKLGEEILIRIRDSIKQT